jgi:putative thioredoxin
LKKNKSLKRAAIFDASDENFKQLVLQRSYKTTVVVDFWAAWCGPCRMLGPVLERIAEEPDGQFVLAKLNTEYNQRTAAQYQIRSIPAVKAFRNGQMVNEFTGALPEPLVRRFIDKVTSGPPPQPAIKASPNPAKRLKQAEQHLKKGRGFEAFVLLKDFPSGPEAERAEKLLPLAKFMVDIEDGDGLTGLDKLDDHYLAASGALHQRNPAKAFEHLDAALDGGESMDDGYTNEIIASLLDLLGENHQVVQQYHKEKQSVS